MNKSLSSALPPAASYSSRKEWEFACWRQILKTPDLLEAVVTEHERCDIVARAVAIQRILSGKSYKQIMEELWLSSQTISGLKKALNEKRYRSYHERDKKERKRRRPSTISRPPERKPRGRPVRTKYGIVYLP